MASSETVEAFRSEGSENEYKRSVNSTRFIDETNLVRLRVSVSKYDKNGHAFLLPFSGLF